MLYLRWSLLGVPRRVSVVAGRDGVAVPDLAVAAVDAQLAAAGVVDDLPPAGWPGRSSLPSGHAVSARASTSATSRGAAWSTRATRHLSSTGRSLTPYRTCWPLGTSPVRSSACTTTTSRAPSCAAAARAGSASPTPPTDGERPTSTSSALQFIQDAATSYRTAPARIRRRMNQALFERIMIEEDGTVVGQLAGPYRQLLDPTLIIPASQQHDQPDAEDAPASPEQEALFDPKAWILGVPAWMCGQAAWQRRNTTKPPTSSDVRGSSRGPGRDHSSLRPGV